MILKVNQQDISLVDPGLELIVSGTGNYYEAEFEFSSEWDGFEKTAVFRTLSGTLAPVLLTSDACGIPTGVITEGGYFVVGVYGVNEETGVHYPTIWTHTITVNEGCSEALDTLVPETGIYEQMLAATNAARAAAQSAAESAEDAQDIAESVQERADSGEFSSTIGVGQVITGTPVRVFNTGTPKDPIFNFVIPQGEAGAAGPEGPAGKSAYTYAREGGYTGTEQDFKISMATAAQSAPLSDSEIQQIWEEN